MALSRILLVEDDRFISELYERSLVRGGYEVKTVYSGPEGLKEAQTGAYDLILLDIMLPDQTGLEVLREMYEDPVLKDTRIVIATNLDVDEPMQREIERMADGYFIKADVTPKTLVGMLRQIDETGEAPQGEGNIAGPAG